MKYILYLIITLLITFSVSGQTKQIKKLFNLYKKQEWIKFDTQYDLTISKYPELTTEVLKFNGILDSDSYDRFKKSSTVSNVKNKLVTNPTKTKYYQELMIIGYLKSLKAIKSQNYSSLLQDNMLLRQTCQLSLLNINSCESFSGLGNINYPNESNPSNCNYKRMLEILEITENNCLLKLKSIDSILISTYCYSNTTNSSTLKGILSSLNFSESIGVFKGYIEEKSVDEALASKDIAIVKSVLQQYKSNKRKQELLTHFDNLFFSSVSKTIKGYQEYIDNFPAGVHLKESKEQIKKMLINNALQSDDLDFILEIMMNYPKSSNQLQKRYDSLYFNRAELTNTINGYEDYLNTVKNGAYKIQAKNKIEEIYVQSALVSENMDQISKAIATYPENSKNQLLKDHLVELKFISAKQGGMLELMDFIKTYPYSKYVVEAKRITLDYEVEQAIANRDINSIKNLIIQHPSHSNDSVMKEIIADATKRAENLKTYTGNYYNGYASYQYYINKEGERVLHGNFKFTLKSSDGLTKYSELKTPLFLSIMSFPTIENPGSEILNPEAHYYHQAQIPIIKYLKNPFSGSFTGKFEHNKKQGLWVFKGTTKETWGNKATSCDEILELKISNDSLVYSNYTLTHSKNCSNCTKINVHFIPRGYHGEYILLNPDGFTKGNYHNGLKVGVWSIKNEHFDPYAKEFEYNFNANTFPAEITRKYNKGVLTFEKIINVETGKIYKR